MAAAAEEVGKPQRQQDAGEEQEGHGGAHGRDGDEGGQEGAQNAAHRVERLHVAHDPAVVLQGVGGVLHQGGGDGAQQEQGIDEEDHAGGEGGDDEKIGADGEDQRRRHRQNHVLAHHRDQGDPHGGDEDAAVEPVRVGVPVGGAAAVEVPQGHGDHDGADDDGPHDLGGAEVGGQQAAGAQLHRHNGHAGEKFRHIKIELVFQNRSLVHRAPFLPHRAENRESAGDPLPLSSVGAGALSRKNRRPQAP